MMLATNDLEEYVDGLRNPGLLAGEQWDLDAVLHDLLAGHPGLSAGDLTSETPDATVMADLDAALRANMRHVVEGTAVVEWETPEPGMDARRMTIGYELFHDDEDGMYTGMGGERFTVPHGPTRYTREQWDDAWTSELVAGDLHDRGWADARPTRLPSGEWSFAAVEKLTLVRENDPGVYLRSLRSCTLTAAEANGWHAGALDAEALSGIARTRLRASDGDLVRLLLGPDYPWYGWSDESAELYRLHVGHEREAPPVGPDSPFIGYGWRPGADADIGAAACDPADPTSFDDARAGGVVR